jgi:hypothetical protein
MSATPDESYSGLKVQPALIEKLQLSGTTGVAQIS